MTRHNVKFGEEVADIQPNRGRKMTDAEFEELDRLDARGFGFFLKTAAVRQAAHAAAAAAVAEITDRRGDQAELRDYMRRKRQRARSNR
ncbi:MAG: hypothetical protein OXQ31_01080 [Spirochaetaceae bacterium]|nr:hypothetical protein [Spirochaetaceae bacterium]